MQPHCHAMLVFRQCLFAKRDEFVDRPLITSCEYGLQGILLLFVSY
jgi:hypothetical protein